jgi:hypothetical protein
VDELLSSECQEGDRFENLQDTDLNKIVTESYSKSTKANTKRARKVFQGKYSVTEIHFRLQNSIKMDLIAVLRFLGVVFVHSDQHTIICISMLYSKPTRRWFSYVLLKNNALLRSRKVAECPRLMARASTSSFSRPQACIIFL